MKFKLKPWDHQLKAIDKARHQECFGLFCEMGTGKTGMAINILREKYYESNRMAVMHQFEDEVEKVRDFLYQIEEYLESDVVTKAESYQSEAMILRQDLRDRSVAHNKEVAKLKFRIAELGLEIGKLLKERDGNGNV